MNEKQAFLLADCALRMLVKKDGRFILAHRSGEALKSALDALFSRTELDPRLEIEGLLRLGHMLEVEHDSIEIADAIIGCLAKDDRALSVLGLCNSTNVNRAKERFRQLAHQGTKLKAPVFGEAAPKGSLKVSSFLQPQGALLRPRGAHPLERKERR